MIKCAKEWGWGEGLNTYRDVEEVGNVRFRMNKHEVTVFTCLLLVKMFVSHHCGNRN